MWPGRGQPGRKMSPMNLRVLGIATALLASSHIARLQVRFLNPKLHVGLVLESGRGIFSRADLAKNCAFRDKSVKLGTWFLDILRSILRNGATSDLTFGDL